MKMAALTKLKTDEVDVAVFWDAMLRKESTQVTFARDYRKSFLCLSRFETIQNEIAH